MAENRDFEEEDAPEYDELEYDDGENSLLRWMSVLFVVFALGGFVALAWYAYKSGMEPLSEDDIPLVEADAGPIKEKPADPGGWQFDHQDKSVYNQLGAPSADRPVAERLLPPPEEPVARPDTGAPAEIEVEKEPVVAAPAEEAIEELWGDARSGAMPTSKPAEITKEKVAISPSSTAPEENTVTVVPSTKSDETTLAVIEPAPVAKPVAPVAKPESKPAATATATPKSGQYMAQLGAFRSEQEAEDAWSKLVRAHGTRLPSHTHLVERADLGAKGIFYRLQAGPFQSDAAAKEACTFFQQHKQGCFVVKK